MKTKPSKKVSPRKMKRREFRYEDRKWDWLNGPYNEAGSEKRLWIAVITQAVLDALNKAKDSESVFYKHEAVCWLTDNSWNFKTVCQFAGLEPEWVRRHAKRAIYDPRPWRAPPREGKRYLERKEYRERQAAHAKVEPETIVASVILFEFA